MIKSMIPEYNLVKLETNISKIIRNTLEIKPDTAKLSLSQRKKITKEIKYILT